MKSYIVLLFVLTLSIISACKTTVKPRVAEAMKMNVVYAQMENPIWVGNGQRGDSVTVTNAQIIKQDYDKFIIIPDTLYGQTCVFKVWSKGKPLLLKEFRIKHIPIPEVRFSGYSGGVVPLSVVKKAMGLNCILENFDFNCTFIINGYSITHIRNEHRNKTITKSAFLGSLARGWVEFAKTGDIFLFSDVKASLLNKDREVLKEFDLGSIYIEVGE